MVLAYGRKPLVVYSPEGDEVAAPVRDQIFAHPGASLVLWHRARFALSLPIAIVQDGSAGQAGATLISSENATALGDLRLGADFRLVGEYGQPFNLAAGFQLYAPTGSQDSYTSDGGVRFAPRVGASGDVGPLMYAALLLTVASGIDYVISQMRGSRTGTQ